MSNRPRSITVIGWIFVVTGCAGLASAVARSAARHPFDGDFLWMCALRLFAILCGVFVLRGSKWARWGLVAWLGYHVALSVLHASFELIVHSLLFVTVLYFLFRPQASVFFTSYRSAS